MERVEGQEPIELPSQIEGGVQQQRPQDKGAVDPAMPLDQANAAQVLQDNKSPAPRAAAAAAAIVLPALFEMVEPKGGNDRKDRNNPKDMDGDTVSFSLDEALIKQQIKGGDRGYAIDVLLTAACSKDETTRLKARKILNELREKPGTGDDGEDEKVRDMISYSERVITRLLVSEKAKNFGELPVELALRGAAHKPKNELPFVYKDEKRGPTTLAPKSEEVDHAIHAYIKMQRDQKHAGDPDDAE